ncbi:MAG: T9SS type A sorting domain-containing protein [Bacteroidetes bacterium]|nr:T9SS type A sorting domain-containing protein [Bacteroidota bacterium]
MVSSLNKKNGRLDFVCHSDRSGNLIILFESRSEFENIRISVMDMTGKELISSCARQDSRVEIPHTIALSGIYIVEISDGETISRKI